MSLSDVTFSTSHFSLDSDLEALREELVLSLAIYSKHLCVCVCVCVCVCPPSFSWPKFRIFCSLFIIFLNTLFLSRYT